MTKCIFCGRDYEVPYGLTEFDITGHTRHYCSSKCRKNYKLGRDNERVKWTKVFHDKKKVVPHKDNPELAAQKKLEKKDYY